MEVGVEKKKTWRIKNHNLTGLRKVRENDKRGDGPTQDLKLVIDSVNLIVGGNKKIRCDGTKRRSRAIIAAYWWKQTGNSVKLIKYVKNTRIIRKPACLKSKSLIQYRGGSKTKIWRVKSLAGSGHHSSSKFYTFYGKT